MGGLIFWLMFASVGQQAPPVPQPDYDTLVVCREEWQPALAPWLAYRKSQGHEVRVIGQYRSAEDLRAQIRRQATAGHLKFVLLVGDSLPGDLDRPGRRGGPPAHLTPARVNVRWGSETEIATDNWYADLDDDRVPDLAIGRWPVATDTELQNVVSKVLEYERHTPAGLWQRRINFVAGVGGFGLLTDAILEAAARSFITRGIPAEYQTSMTYGSWRSPYCPDPRSFRRATIDRLNEGCLAWVYIGHGQRAGLDWIRVPIGVAPVLEKQDVSRVRVAQGMPIAIFLCCYVGAFDGEEECLGERLLAQPGGPVAVLAGSRMTMPYGMSVLSDALMKEMFEQRHATLGEMFLESKRRMMRLDPDDVSRPLIDSLAKVLSPDREELDLEIEEHLDLFNLLGDPLLRLPQRESLDVSTARTAEPGATLEVECRGPVAGECTVELACLRGRTTAPAPMRATFDGSDEGMLAYNETYRLANDDRFVKHSFRTEQGGFRLRLKVPDDADGPCTLRVFVQDGTRHAMGASSVYVAVPRTSRSLAETSAGTR